MQLQTNSLSANSVRRETRNGKEYLVAEDVVFGRPLHLDGGYVPAEEWRKSVESWDGVPLPVGHPLDQNGNPLAVSENPVVERATSAGQLENPRYDPDTETISGDLWINVEQTKDLGHYGERVIELLENGEGLEVSSTYRGEDAEPGVYDGKHRSKVKVNLQPDSLALLPDELGPGKCSHDEGCGIPPTDNPQPGQYAVAANSDSRPSLVGLCFNASGEIFRGGREVSVPTASGLIATNQQEGDRVRWVGQDGEVRYGIVVDELEDDDADKVYVALYEHDPDKESSSSDKSNWHSRDEQRRMSKDTLEVIDQFPAEPADSEDVDANAASLVANTRSSARNPTYNGGTESSEWSAPSLSDYQSGYDLSDGDWEDLPQDDRSTIVSKTLLGEASADSFDDARAFPVVNPSTDALNENALDAVIGGRGSQANYGEDAVDSAQSKARSLLESKFDRDLDTNAANVGTDADDPFVSRMAQAFRRAFPGLASNDDVDAADIDSQPSAADGDTFSHSHTTSYDDSIDANDWVDSDTPPDADEWADTHTGNDGSGSSPEPSSIDMNRNERIETLVEQHGFKPDSLTSMGDNCLERTYQLATNSEADPSDGSGDDGGDDAQASDADGDNNPEAEDDSPESESDSDTSSDSDSGTESESESDSDSDSGSESDAPGDSIDVADLAARVESLESEKEELRSTVEDREDKIERLEEMIDEQDAAEQTYSETLNEQINGLTQAFSDEQLAEMSIEHKESVINALTSGAGGAGATSSQDSGQSGMAANGRSGTDFGALSASSPHMNVNNSSDGDEDDDSGGTKYGGSFGAALRGEGD